MDPFRLLARQQLRGSQMIGTGFGLFREPASVPMLTQQVKGTGGSSNSQGISGSSNSQGVSGAADMVSASGGLFGIPWWVIGLGVVAYALMSGKNMDKPATKRDVMIWG